MGMDEAIRQQLWSDYLAAGLDPAVEFAKIDRMHEYEDRYYEARKCCPKCHGRNMMQTLMGFLPNANNLEAFKDRNDVRCDCGWVGIVHDLVKE